MSHTPSLTVNVLTPKPLFLEIQYVMLVEDDFPEALKFYRFVLVESAQGLGERDQKRNPLNVIQKRDKKKTHISKTRSLSHIL